VHDLVGFVAVVIPSCAYMLGVQRIWATAGRGRIVSIGKAKTFAAGMGVEFVALCSPLASWSERNLSDHMVQHVLLLGVVGPLLGLGAPLPTLLWALPTTMRSAALRKWRRVVASTRGPHWVGWLTATLCVNLVALVGWHLPPLYDAAVRNEVLHGLEHLSYVATSAAFWWVLAGTGRRARWGYSVLALFVTSLAGIALGAAMTLASSPWYAAYRHAAHPLRDQQTAGVIMWAFGGIITLVGALAVLVAWLDFDSSTLSPGSEGVNDGGDDAEDADSFADQNHRL
jgi:putative membrane protein